MSALQILSKDEEKNFNTPPNAFFDKPYS